MARVLLVEDDPYVRSAMAAELTTRAHAVRTAGTALDGIREVSHHPPEVVVLDLGLPDLDGSQALKMMRAITAIPVIVATARDEEAEIIRLLNDGADDYVVKPFSPAELAARVGTVLRRSGANRVSATSNGTLEFGDLVIDTLAREIRVSDRLVETTAKEFALLAFLAGSPRQVFTREQLLAQVWDSSSEWQDAGTVTEHIRRIRRKIEVDPDSPRWVRTVRGVGYRFEP